MGWAGWRNGNKTGPYQCPGLCDWCRDTSGDREQQERSDRPSFLIHPEPWAVWCRLIRRKTKKLANPIELTDHSASTHRAKLDAAASRTEL